MQQHADSSAAVARWTPALEGAEAEKARATAVEIAHAVLDAIRLPNDRPSGLASGPAGVAVFLAEMARHEPDGPWADAASELLDIELEALADADHLDLGLYTGATGTAWALAHLEGHLFESDDDDNDLDEVIAHAVATPKWPGEFDLILGLAGIGTYCLERLPRPTAHRSLERVVHLLRDQAIESDGGIAWRTSPRVILDQDRKRSFPEGYWDTGLAHGASGVIAMLAAAATAGIPEAADTCRAATTWLLAQRLTDDTRGAYPLIFDGDIGRNPGRHAWCYGDAGVAIALLAAADALEDDEIRAEAVRVTTQLADTPLERAGASDPALCHGAGGLAQVLNRLGQGLGLDAPRERARQWIQVAHRMRVPGEACAGFLAARPDDDGNMTATALPGFLEGAAGVGLAMLAASSELEPSWDAALLLSPARAWASR